MREGEAKDLDDKYPLIGTVLRKIQEGGSIKEGDPLWPTYLIVRQRGLVQRTGPDKRTIVPSARAGKFAELVSRLRKK